MSAKRKRGKETDIVSAKAKRLVDGRRKKRPISLTKREIIAKKGPQNALETFLRVEPQTDIDLWKTAHQSDVPDANRVLLLKHINDQSGLDASQLLVNAAYHDMKNTARLIIDNFEFDINYRDINGNTALCTAARMNDDNEIAFMLLEQDGIDINIKGINQRSAVWFAACNKNKELLDRLLDLGVDTLATDVENTLPEERTSSDLADEIRNTQDMGLDLLTLDSSKEHVE